MTERPTGGGQLAVLTALGLALLFVVVVLAQNLARADGPLAILLALTMGVIAIGLQAYYARRVLRDWDSMTTGSRWLTGLAAVVVPLAAGFFGPLLALLALAVWLVSVFSNAGAGGVGRPITGATSGVGRWWGGSRVISRADGRAAWIGDEEVIHDGDGRMRWVGEREVSYGSDGRPLWVGGDKVIYGADTDVPRWIGDQEVQP